MQSDQTKPVATIIIKTGKRGHPFIVKVDESANAVVRALAAELIRKVVDERVA